MRILLLCNKSPWPPRDGGAFATLNLIRCLSEMNVKISVLALNPDKHHADQNIIPEEVKRLAVFRLIDIRTGIKPFRFLVNLLFSKKPYNLSRFWSKEYLKELKNLITDEYDLIQIEGLAMHQYLKTIRDITSVPVVFRPHNIENLIWSGLSNEETNIFKKIYFRILASRLRETERHIVNDFDAIIPISSYDITWFRDLGLEKPSIVHTMGFASFSFSPTDNIQNNAVCFIGALDWLPNIKGLFWFIKKVWPLVLKYKPEAEFHIAGRNASQKTILKLKGSNIIFEGEVESSEQFLKNKVIIAVPLFSGSGARIKILEGMSMGKCIVATHLAASGIEYEDRKNLFICENAQSFAEEIVKLLNDVNLRVFAGNNAIGNVRKNYDILATSQKLITFYQKLLA